MSSIITTRRAAWLAASALVALASPAFAQDANTQPTAETSTNRATVIVTATRREENLQEVPVAVTAVPEALVRNAGIRDIRDLTQVTPSLQVPVSENSSSVTARIRGVGTQGSNPGLESAVGVMVDGVVRARNGVAFGDLGEIERIEVLRGPQGTLFGRNTSAGVINVITKKPEFDFGASAELTVGDYGQAGFAGNVTGALLGSDKIAGRAFVAFRGRDGFISLNPGRADARDTNDLDYVTMRGQILWELSDTADIRFAIDYTDRGEACCAAATKIPAGTAGIINAISAATGRGQAKATRNTVSDYIGFADRDYDQSIQDKGVQAELNWEVGPGNLTYVVGARKWEYTYGQDADFSGIDIVYRTNDGSALNKFTTITHEVRYAGTTGNVDWLVGGFLSNETINRNDRFATGADYDQFLNLLLVGGNAAGLPGLRATLNGALGVAPTATLVGNQAGTRDFFKQRGISRAIFTHNVVNFTDTFKLTLGLRYTDEEKTYLASHSTIGNRACQTIEGRLGLNPSGAVVGTPLAALGGAIGAICVPWTRGALDRLGAYRQSRSEGEWSGIVSGAWQATDFVNLYASYSRGYKGGGFNLDRAFADSRGSIVSGAPGAQTVRAPDTSFEAEVVDAYELGAKTEWLDGALVINAALYYQQFDNFQLNTFNGISFVVTAVPEVISQGVEVDFVYNTGIDGLNLNGGLAYTDAKYGDNLGSLANPNSFLGRNPNLVNLPGSQLTSSPEWTVSGGASYERELAANLKFSSYIDARYTSEFNTGSNLDPRKLQDGFTLINARLGLSHPDDFWSLELWGRNLTDERYTQITFDSPLQGSAPALNSATDTRAAANARANSQIDAFLAEPRTWGVTLRLRR